MEIQLQATSIEGFQQKQPAISVQYGKNETKRAISNVLESVINGYKYSSLPELSAILSVYNIIADPGKEGSKMYENIGLVYTVLDTSGNKIGLPVKASSFYNRSTLKYLEKKFSENNIWK